MSSSGYFGAAGDSASSSAMAARGTSRGQVFGILGPTPLAAKKRRGEERRGEKIGGYMEEQEQEQQR